MKKITLIFAIAALALASCKKTSPAPTPEPAPSTPMQLDSLGVVSPVGSILTTIRVSVPDYTVTINNVVMNKTGIHENSYYGFKNDVIRIKAKKIGTNINASVLLNYITVINKNSLDSLDLTYIHQ